MTNLNLQTTSYEQEKIKAYLENNASETLAEKINNGVRLQKDGKTLINKKDLTTFMTYAEEKVLKFISENERKGRQMRCIDDPTVYGWAIQYFEKDSIEGKLYNEDGTEYKPAPTKSQKVNSSINTTTPPKPAPKPQLNIFDMLADNTKSETPPTPVVPEQPKPEQPKGSPMYQHYLSIKKEYNDCIIFYRLGDFYEMFNSDAVTAAKELNLTLTSRDCGLNERIPMTGIPFHAADAYISKLVNKNYKVAVCEQLDGKKSVERVIVKSNIENRLIDIKTGEYLSNEIEKSSIDEMQQTDGNIDEPEELLTVSKLIGETTNENDILDDDFDIEEERQAIKAFNVETIAILQILFDNKITLV